MICFLLRLAPSCQNLLPGASESENWVRIAHDVADSAVEVGARGQIEHVRELNVIGL